MRTLITETVEIISAHISHNAVPASELPGLIRNVHRSLLEIVGGVKTEVVVERAVQNRRCRLKSRCIATISSVSKTVGSIRPYAAICFSARHDAGGLSRQVGFARRLPLWWRQPTRSDAAR